MVTNNSITGNNAGGMDIGLSGNNVIVNNSITGNNVAGIVMVLKSRCNSICGNDIMANEGGGVVVGSTSSGNMFYLNRFINNTRGNAFSLSINGWDNGRVGNYWDDYVGYDSDGDSIGDTPYGIPPYRDINKDRYPTGRFKSNVTPPIDTPPPKVMIDNLIPGHLYIASRGGNHHAGRVPSYWGTALIIALNGFTIDAYAVDFETGIREVRFYVDNENKPRDIEIKQVPEQKVYTWHWDETIFWEEHTIRAVAYDEAGNNATATIKVKVFNIHI